MIPLCVLAIESEDDREFMAAIFCQYQKLMYYTTKKILLDQWLTDDAVQTVVERLIDKISLLRSLDRDRLTNYIISTCKNTAYNLLRHYKRHEVFSFEEAFDTPNNLDSQLSIEDYLAIRENLSCLTAVWPQLDHRSQYLLEARYILDKKPAEIAEDLGIKPESVRMALSRARKKAYTLIIDETRRQ